MTDESLIVDFIENNFELSFGNEEILIIDKRFSSQYNSSGLYSIINTIFGEWEDTPIQPDILVKKWYESSSKNFLSELDTFLCENKIELVGAKLAIVTSEGESFNLKQLIKNFEPRINANFVGSYFTKWFNLKQKELITQHLRDELNGYDVRLGPTDWVVINSEGKTTNEKILMKKFQWADSTTIDKIYTNWKQNKIIKVSSKMMGIYDEYEPDTY